MARLFIKKNDGSDRFFDQLPVFEGGKEDDKEVSGGIEGASAQPEESSEGVFSEVETVHDQVGEVVDFPKKKLLSYEDIEKNVDIISENIPESLSEYFEWAFKSPKHSSWQKELAAYWEQKFETEDDPTVVLKAFIKLIAKDTTYSFEEYKQMKKVCDRYGSDFFRNEKKKEEKKQKEKTKIVPPPALATA